MFCLKCGETIPDESVTCPKCGELIKKEFDSSNNDFAYSEIWVAVSH
ncbi:zinc ribbon domain-containing protein [Staphylococcus nepalensis]|nr:zinc ribbon domain-containing protein [Staphylococcus nepalensis]